MAFQNASNIDASHSVFNDVKGNQYIIYTSTSSGEIITQANDGSMTFIDDVRVQAIQASRTDTVGEAKTMNTTATLYRDGTLICNVMTDCRDPLHGLWGRVLVTIIDRDSCAIGSSEPINCATRGGTLDLFTPSSGQETFVQRMAEDVARRAVRLDIHQSAREDMVHVRPDERVIKIFKRLF